VRHSIPHRSSHNGQQFMSCGSPRSHTPVPHDEPCQLARRRSCRTCVFLLVPSTWSLRWLRLGQHDLAPGGVVRKGPAVAAGIELGDGDGLATAWRQPARSAGHRSRSMAGPASKVAFRRHRAATLRAIIPTLSLSPVRLSMHLNPRRPQRSQLRRRSCRIEQQISLIHHPLSRISWPHPPRRHRPN
jgi:hypothetical protein